VLTISIAVASAIAAVLATGFSARQAYLLRRQLERGDLVDRAEFYQRLTRAFSELNMLFIDALSYGRTSMRTEIPRILLNGNASWRWPATSPMSPKAALPQSRYSHT
jgi:hypothetical protein